LDISAPRLAGSGTTGIGPDATKPIRLLASAESAVSAGNVTPGHFRSAIGTLENSHSLISLELPADAPNSAAAGATTGELPVARSANSEMSSLSSTALSDQLPNQLLRSVDGGGGDIVLKLNPPELGDLMVRVLVNGRDVSAWFATPQIQVQQAISQAIGQLNTELGHAGYNLNGAWVGADGWSARQQERNLATPQQRGNRSKIDEPRDVATQPAAFGVSVYV
jgi:flagellar hook-length control protein FliK